MAGALKRTIGQRPGHILFGGTSASELAPYTFAVGIGQFPYMIDYNYADQFNLEPLDYLRDQQDTRDAPGEQSINPAGLWRRSQNSWHLGAGQETFDRPNSSEYRFDNSTGVDIWTKWKLGLLHDTDQKLSSGNTNLKMAVAGIRLYTLDGSALKYTTNIDVDTPTFTALTGTPPGVNGSSIVSDGFNVFTAHGTAGIWKTNNTLAAWAGAAHITGTVTLLGFVRGRVLAANNNIVYDVTTLAQGGGGALPTALFTQPNSDFKWTCFAEGRNAIYMGGYSGDKSLIYKATIKSDGTGLDVPLVAAEFEGEQVESLYGYLGPFLAIGVGMQPGWRFAQIDENRGDLTIGARVSTPKPVLCFEGQEAFIWFGYSNYSASQTGLGRFSVQEFGNPDQFVPAYASDLMVNNQTADIQSIVTFSGIRVFSVQGIGIYATHHLRNKVASGTLDTGEIFFNMNEDKIGLFVDVVQLGTGGSHGLYVAFDGSSLFNFVGEHTEHTDSFHIGEVVARTFNLRLELKRDATTPTLAQELAAWLFRAQVIPSVTRIWRLPLLLANPMPDLDGNKHHFDCWAALDDLANLHKSKTITQLKIGTRAYPVIVEKYKYRIHKLDDILQNDGFNATCVVDLKILTEDI